MLLLECNAEFDSSCLLMESGSAVNSAGDGLGQSPAHLAACGGQAFFLLWQLQTGADLNQQDCFGEAPIHKAAKSGSLQCLSLLVAGDARVDMCNNNGETAEDLAWSSGYLECARFLSSVKHTQNIKLQLAPSVGHGVMTESLAGQKRPCSSDVATDGKRVRFEGF
ncbi:ankyrin repeat domain-containing protein 37 [Ambystoma mexicanum]|uniref:ankyrin repeat domain-containing protein 37 n=1 Tax=Ambystoma mexicanum TaxID=8296 RepID=UPI0037E707AA